MKSVKDVKYLKIYSIDSDINWSDTVWNCVCPRQRSVRAVWV